MKVKPYKERYCRERLGEEGVRRARELYEAGVPVREIMRELGLGSPECIYVVVGPGRRGGYRRRARVTPELEERVLELRRQGLSIPKIAEALGISVGSVHRVLKKHGLAGRLSRGRDGGEG